MLIFKWLDLEKEKEGQIRKVGVEPRTGMQWNRKESHQRSRSEQDRWHKTVVRRPLRLNRWIKSRFRWLWSGAGKQILDCNKSGNGFRLKTKNQRWLDRENMEIRPVIQKTIEADSLGRENRDQKEIREGQPRQREILGMLLDNLKLQFSFFLFPQIGIMTVLTELERGLNKLKLKMVLFHSHYYHRGQCDILCRVSGENIMEKWRCRGRAREWRPFEMVNVSE